MNWLLFWALTLAFGVMISNLLLIKYAARFKMLPLPKQPQSNADNVTSPDLATEQSHQHGQTPNTPE